MLSRKLRGGDSGVGGPLCVSGDVRRDVTPGVYDVAATWVATAGAYSSQYTVLAGGASLGNTVFDQSQAPANPDGWADIGIFYIAGSSITVTLTSANAYANYPLVADAVQVQRLQGDHGGDDNFHVLSTAPTIDIGDPASPYLAEPAPNGGRVNVGYDGNTAQAAASPAQLVQVLSPTKLDKLQVGQPTTITWRSDGLTENRPVVLVNAGGTTIDNWLADGYQTTGGGYAGSFTDPVDASAVTNPAPQAVYQSYAQAAYGVGNELAYQLPVPDGTYTVRLDFAEPNVGTQPGDRVFDVQLQNATVQPSYDIAAAAGAAETATALTFTVTVSGGSGIALALLNDTYQPAILSGIEVSAANPHGVANPTVNLQLSTDNGATWTTLAAGLTMDTVWQRQLYLDADGRHHRRHGDAPCAGQRRHPAGRHQRRVLDRQQRTQLLHQ